MINIKYYVALTIKRTYGEEKILIAGTSLFQEIYRTYSTLQLSEDTQLYLPKNIYLQQSIVHLSLQIIIVYISCLPMYLYHHMYKPFSVGRHRFQNEKVTWMVFITVLYKFPRHQREKALVNQNHVLHTKDENVGMSTKVHQSVFEQYVYIYIYIYIFICK